MSLQKTNDIVAMTLSSSSSLMARRCGGTMILARSNPRLFPAKAKVKSVLIVSDGIASPTSLTRTSGHRRSSICQMRLHERLDELSYYLARQSHEPQQIVVQLAAPQPAPEPEPTFHDAITNVVRSIGSGMVISGGAAVSYGIVANQRYRR
ncbi:hypothetical protein [Acidisphaera sp. L21]|uniref:hypothetical protein n=1 Tax=Acidisphaera sp. L21 TaxID=1641851 RepID=UPI00131AF112|nr:hypothetical protein [Acidisphaera sp. L21]